jgi:hypothetical protein
LIAAIRKLALRFLLAVIAHSSAERKAWGKAMLRELDFVESEWQGLVWALGSAGVLLRYAFPDGVRALLAKGAGLWQQPSLRGILGKAAELAIGIAVSAGVSGASVYGLRLFPGWHAQEKAWAQCLAVLFIPETIFVCGVVLLWWRRRVVAKGILVGALTLLTHFVMYMTTHE